MNILEHSTPHNFRSQHILLCAPRSFSLPFFKFDFNLLLFELNDGVAKSSCGGFGAAFSTCTEFNTIYVHKYNTSYMLFYIPFYSLPFVDTKPEFVDLLLSLRMKIPLKKACNKVLDENIN